MQTFAAFLISMVTPVVGRVLTALGFGFVSYAAVNSLVNSLTQQAITEFNGLPAQALAIANIGGAGEILSIAVSALATRAALVSVQKLAKLPGA